MWPGVLQEAGDDILHHLELLVKQGNKLLLNTEHHSYICGELRNLLELPRPVRGPGRFPLGALGWDIRWPIKWSIGWRVKWPISWLLM